MLLSKMNMIRWSPKIKKYYEGLGYKWTKQGDVFTVKTNELLPSSLSLVTLKCDECGAIFERHWVYRIEQFKKHNKDLCYSCSKKGSRNSQYGKERKDLLDYARSFKKQNSMFGKHHSLAARIKMSEIKAKQIADGTFNIISNNRGHKLQYKSIKSNEIFYADSALERLRMEQLDKDDTVLSWTKRHKISIPYIIDNETKNYIPDFFIIYKNGDKVIEETKGYVKGIDLIKKDYAEIFCKHHNYIYKFTTQKEMNKNGEYRVYLKKLKENGEI